METAQKQNKHDIDLYLAREHIRDFQHHGEPHHLNAAISILKRVSHSLASASVGPPSMGNPGEDARAPTLRDATNVGAAILAFLDKNSLSLDQQFATLAGAQLAVVRRIIAQNGGAL